MMSYECPLMADFCQARRATHGHERPFTLIRMNARNEICPLTFAVSREVKKHENLNVALQHLVPALLPRQSVWLLPLLATPDVPAFPALADGSACASSFSRIAQRSVTLRPAHSPSHLCDPLHQRLQPLRYLHDCSGCFRLEQKLPGGACTHWEIAAFPRHTPNSDSQNRMF